MFDQKQEFSTPYRRVTYSYVTNCENTVLIVRDFLLEGLWFRYLGYSYRVETL